MSAGCRGERDRRWGINMTVDVKRAGWGWNA